MWSCQNGTAPKYPPGWARSPGTRTSPAEGGPGPGAVPGSPSAPDPDSGGPSSHGRRATVTIQCAVLLNIVESGKPFHGLADPEAQLLQRASSRCVRISQSRAAMCFGAAARCRAQLSEGGRSHADPPAAGVGPHTTAGRPHDSGPPRVQASGTPSPWAAWPSSAAPGPGGGRGLVDRKRLCVSPPSSAPISVCLKISSEKK